MLKYLVEKFADQFQRKTNPSILIVREDAPKSVLNIDSLIAFRNIFAICSIIESWQDFLNSGRHSTSVPYSNYFDIFPIHPGRDRNILYTLSDSLTGLDDEIHKFRGQTSPGLANLEYVIKLDRSLKNELLCSWKERHVKRKKRDRKLLAIFRSLEMAYLALRMPDNPSSIYNYGINIALWVSAFEVLVHPGGRQRVGYQDVWNVLSKAKFIHSQLNNKSFRISYFSNRPVGRKYKYSITLSQKLYWQMYTSRNNFLHGNPVSSKDLYPFNKPKRYPLTMYAPLLFKLSLKSVLNIMPNADQMRNLQWPERWEARRFERMFPFSSMGLD